MKSFISVVIPVYNEAAALPELHRRLAATLGSYGAPYELIFVNDGSQDGSASALSALSPARVLALRRNYGQTVALAAGIRAARGEIIVTIDADLENYPEDIPMLLDKLDEGYDVVTGWRTERWQNTLTRRLISQAANALLSRLSGTWFHDSGCTLRAYRAAVFSNASFSGDMHRLILAYLSMRGAKILEMPVRFSPRRYGRSHYGLWRIFNTLIDILAFMFFERYPNKPLHFFGAAGAAMLGLSFATFFAMVALRVSGGPTFIETPLPVLAVFFALAGFQAILTGLVAEFLYRFSKSELATSAQDYVKEEREQK